MPGLQYKLLAAADDVRPFPNGHAEVVHVDETTVARVIYEPGWRWSRDLAPIMGTPTCQLHHFGYSVSGVMHVAMDDGLSLDIPQGCVFEIPQGHDAWVIGDEGFVAFEFEPRAVETYARQ